MGIRRILMNIIGWPLLLLSGAAGFAQQDITVRGTFLADSLRVGDEIFFALSARYPTEWQVVFPDSSFNYAPFEFDRKRVFITRTQNGVSFDSAVYYLRAFETDAIQRLRLPVFQVNALDCTRHLTNWDTVRMQLMVKVTPETIGPDLPIRATIAYQHVPKQFNFSLVVIAATMTLLLAGVMWVVFGSRVKKYFWRKRLTRNHLNFINHFTAEIDTIKGSFSPVRAEAALAMWKKYMEGLNRKPYTRLTTRETFEVEKDDNMMANLRKMDAAIYGTHSEVVEPLNNLRMIADRKFDQKLQEVRDE